MSDSAHVIEATTQTFQAEVAERSLKTPVLVDLWATWCEPCKVLGPVLEKVAADYAGGFVVAKVDVDGSPEIAQALGVQSVPTCFLLKEGRPVDAFAGAVSEKQLIDFLKGHRHWRAITHRPLAAWQNHGLAIKQSGHCSGAMFWCRECHRHQRALTTDVGESIGICS